MRIVLLLAVLVAYGCGTLNTVDIAHARPGDLDATCVEEKTGEWYATFDEPGIAAVTWFSARVALYRQGELRQYSNAPGRTFDDGSMRVWCGVVTGRAVPHVVVILPMGSLGESAGR